MKWWEKTIANFLSRFLRSTMCRCADYRVKTEKNKLQTADFLGSVTDNGVSTFKKNMLTRK